MEDREGMECAMRGQVTRRELAFTSSDPPRLIALHDATYLRGGREETGHRFRGDCFRNAGQSLIIEYEWSEVCSFTKAIRKSSTPSRGLGSSVQRTLRVQRAVGNRREQRERGADRR